jgi:hypothetical protein
VVQGSTAAPAIENHKVVNVMFRVSNYVRLLAFALTLTAITAQSRADRLLRWKLQPGEAIDVRMVQDMDMTTNVLGKPLASSADMSMVMRWVIEDVDQEGVTEMRQSIQRLQMTMQTPGGAPVVYDSASQDAPVGMAKNLAKNMQPLIGVEFIQTMSPRGEIIDVRLSDAANAKLARAPAGAQVREVFSDDGIKSLLHQAATVLPERAVKPGDQWTGVTRTQSPVGTLVMNNVYTYRGTVKKDGRALDRIDVEVNVSFAKGNNALGVKVDIEQQENRGVMYFDAEKGRFVETMLAQKMTLVTAIGDQNHEQQLVTKLRMQFAGTGAPPTKQNVSVGRKPASTKGR